VLTHDLTRLGFFLFLRYQSHRRLIATLLFQGFQVTYFASVTFVRPVFVYFFGRLLATGRSIILISLKIPGIVICAVVPVIVPPAENDKVDAVKNVYPAVFLYPFCPNDIFHNLLFIFCSRSVPASECMLFGRKSIPL
jgi:hypothetical protein